MKQNDELNKIIESLDDAYYSGKTRLVWEFETNDPKAKNLIRSRLADLGLYIDYDFDPSDSKMILVEW